MQRKIAKNLCCYARASCVNILNPLKKHSSHNKSFSRYLVQCVNPLNDHAKEKSRSCVSLNFCEIGQHSVRSFSKQKLVDSGILEGEFDHYNGVWVDLGHLTPGTDIQVTMDVFDKILQDSLQHWKSNNVTSVWLTVPINQGKLIEVASQHAFQFHHAEGTSATLIHCISEDVRARIPQFATHQVGVSGVVVHEENQEILVVKDKNRKHKLWKFPGGLSDLGEDIAETAVREVLEETGVQTVFQSILTFRQQHDHPNAFGRSDIYIICRLKPLTFDLQPCSEEIAAIQWIPVERLLTESDISQMTQTVANLVAHGLRHGFNTIDIISHEIESLYKKRKIQMFHRPCIECV